MFQDDLISMLRCFPALRTLCLYHSFRCLNSGRETPWTTTGRNDIVTPSRAHAKGKAARAPRARAKSARVSAKAVRAAPQTVHPAKAVEAGMLWYTSRIAQHMPSIETFYVRDEGQEYLDSIKCRNDWSTEGWLSVESCGSRVESCEGRRVVGALRVDVGYAE